jgi:hypothetical protein
MILQPARSFRAAGLVESRGTFELYHEERVTKAKYIDDIPNALQATESLPLIGNRGFCVQTGLRLLRGGGLLVRRATA